MMKVIIKNPVFTIEKTDLIEILKRAYADLRLPPEAYGNFIPDGKTLRIEEGQRGEFVGITIELIPKD